MKESLEYKILKYLFKEDNTEFIDVSTLESDFELSKITVESLEIRRFLDKKTRNTNGVKNETGTNLFPKILECKITLLGKEYLLNIEKSIIEVKLAKSNLKSNKINIKNSRINLGFMIFNVIFVIINILLLIYKKE